MESTVAQLSLRIRTRATARPGTRGDVESFAAGGLDRCAQLLEARAPGRVVRIRELDTRWRLREGSLTSAQEMDAVAQELADAIDARANAASRLTPDDDIAVFTNDVHWYASSLRAIAVERTAPWWAATFGAVSGRPHGHARDRVAIRGALVRFVADGDAVKVLTSLSNEQALALVYALSLDDLLVTLPSASASVPAAMRQVVEALPASLAPASLVLLCHAMVGHLIGVDNPPPNAVLAALSAYDIRERANSGLRRLPSVSHDNPESHDILVTDAGDSSTTTTAAAGLVYLLAPALEMEVGEILWKSCVDECVLLARVLRRIAKNADPALAHDPAIALLSGTTADAHCDVIDEARWMEISTSLLHALGTAMSRRGNTPPTLRLALAHPPTGRVLVAWLDGTPFPAFTWPARTSSALRDGVRAAVSAWSTNGIIAAPAALASLAPAHRIRADIGDRTTHDTGVVTAITAATAEMDHVVAQVAGTLGALLAHRAQWPANEAAMRLAEAVATPGEFVADRDKILVRMPMSHVNLALRRAALDRDPGWTPWLQRAVHIVFTDGAEPLFDRER